MSIDVAVVIYVVSILFMLIDSYCSIEVVAALVVLVPALVVIIVEVV